MLRGTSRRLGVDGAHRRRSPRRSSGGDDGHRPAVRQAGTEEGAPTEVIEAQVVVFSAGIRPRDAPGPRVRPGGRRARRRRSSTSSAAPPTRASSRSASARRPTARVRPGRARATRWPRSSPTRSSAATATFTGADMSTKLKLLGVDVASFGDAHRRPPRARSRSSTPTRSPASTRSSSSTDDGQPLLGGILVGDASAYGVLRAAGQQRARAAGRPRAADPRPPSSGVPSSRCPTTRRSAPATTSPRATIVDAIAEQGCDDVPAVKACTKAGTSCGSLRAAAEERCSRTQFASVGKVVDKALCEHFGYTRQELFDIVRGARHPHVRRARRRATAPAAAATSASPRSPSILRHPGQRPHPRRRAGRAAGHQRPLPGQPPAQRHLLGRAAHPRRRDHPRQADRDRRGGPRLRPLHEDHRRAAHRPVRRPGRAAARDLAAAGRRRLRVRPRLRQGAAHGEVVRRRDLVPLRRAGLGRPRDRAGAALPRPARPAQAQVGGVAAAPASAPRRAARTSASSPPRRAGTSTSAATAASTPRHADLLAADLDTETLVRYIDRFLMFYIRTADRLQRTAPGSRSSRAGSTTCATVIVDDSLGLCADLDAAMARHVGGVRRRVARDARRPGEAARGSSPSSTRPDTPDPSIAFATERDQIQPIAPALIPVGSPRMTRRQRVSPGPRSARSTRSRSRAVSPPSSTARRWRSSGRYDGAVFAHRQPRPVQRGVGALARHRRHPRRRAGGELADVQAGLRPPHRRLPRRRGGAACASYDVAVGRTGPVGRATSAPAR